MAFKVSLVLNPAMHKICQPEKEGELSIGQLTGACLTLANKTHVVGNGFAPGTLFMQTDL